MDADKCPALYLFRPPVGHRRSVRMKGYDYSRPRLYFVTICCYDNRCRFGEIVNGEMVLDDFGKIANDEWAVLMERYPGVTLDAYQIMPNHVHCIIELRDRWEDDPHGCSHQCGDCTADRNENPNAPDGRTCCGKGTGQPAPAPTIATIVMAYKSLVANKCLKICKSRGKYMGKLWQRNYHDRVIRSEQAYQKIANYIANNPANWKIDKIYAAARDER